MTDIGEAIAICDREGIAATLAKLTLGMASLLAPRCRPPAVEMAALGEGVLAEYAVRQNGRPLIRFDLRFAIGATWLVDDVTDDEMTEAWLALAVHELTHWAADEAGFDDDHGAAFLLATQQFGRRLGIPGAADEREAVHWPFSRLVNDTWAGRSLRSTLNQHRRGVNQVQQRRYGGTVADVSRTRVGKS